MTRPLLIATCCIVAIVCFTCESVDGVKRSHNGKNQCKNDCKASCVERQKNGRRKSPQKCKRRCEKLAETCAVCPTRKKCSVCQPGYKLVERRCVVEVPTTQCLAGIQVVYADVFVDVPPGTIKEVHGYDNSISSGFDGPYIWLFPVWQPSSYQAVTGIDIILSTDHIQGYSDLAAGDGLDYYRYLEMFRNETEPCIRQIALWRAETDVETPDQQGWQGYTTDINIHRGGGFLYLCWKVD